MSYFEYYTEVKKPVLGLVKKYTIGLPADKKEGYLTLSVNMPEHWCGRNAPKPSV